MNKAISYSDAWSLCQLTPIVASVEFDRTKDPSPGRILHRRGTVVVNEAVEFEQAAVILLLEKNSPLEQRILGEEMVESLSPRNTCRMLR